MFVALFLGPVWAQAQTDPTSGWQGILTAYGVAAPFALLCLWQIQRLSGELKELRAENSKLNQATIERIVPAALQLTAAATGATQAVQEATLMQQALSSQRLSTEDLEDFRRLMRRIETRLGNG